MKELARNFIWWPGLDDDIQSRVEACTKCQINQKLPSSHQLSHGNGLNTRGQEYT